MSHLTSFLLLAVCAAATPSSHKVDVVRSGDASGKNAAIAACEAAPNCETYTDQHGDPRVRFKQGMGPGSAAYDNRKIKRDGSATSTITFGDSKLIWGCNVNPVDSLSNVTAACAPGSAACDPGPITTPIQYLDPTDGVTEPVSQSLTFTATGTYPVWAELAFTNALVAAGSQGITWQNDVPWASPAPGGGHLGQASQNGGTCNLATQTDFIDIATYIGNSLEGHIGVKMTLPAIKNGFCDDQTPEALGTAVAGALPGAGPAVAEVLGVITAICSAVSASSS